jgi:hypothetical protein
MRPRHLAAGFVAVSSVLAAGGTAHAAVTNPYYPLLPGMRWVYRGHKDRDRVRDVVKVSKRIEVVDGVPCAVVIDRVYVKGRLAEDTIDWYAQDASGTVRYYGEATREVDARGHTTSTEGSWRAGVNGARAGIFMPADPKVGQSFAQESYRGHAEDHFRVLSRRATISVPFGSYSREALMTREWTPIEPGVRDAKWYVRGIGEVAEVTLKGGSERLELVSFRRR